MVKILGFSCVRTSHKKLIVYMLSLIYQFAWIFTRNIFSINEYVLAVQYLC